MPFGETVATVADIAGARVRMTGTTTGREPYMLVNSAADFSAVGNGWLVVNTTTGQATYAEKPINTGGGTYQKLQLREDIFAASSGEDYEILRPGRLIIRPPYGYEPNIRVIRWAALPNEPDPTIYGIELWVTNGLTPAALIEKTTRKLVSGTEGTTQVSYIHKTNAEGLIAYEVSFPPTYHAALEIRNYSKRKQTVYLAGWNKSQPIVPSQAQGGQ
jgi:hypothetical protein